VDFVETIAVLVARIFASAVADGLVLIASGIPSFLGMGEVHPDV
jgi:hypothetical protein